MGAVAPAASGAAKAISKLPKSNKGKGSGSRGSNQKGSGDVDKPNSNATHANTGSKSKSSNGHKSSVHPSANSSHLPNGSAISSNKPNKGGKSGNNGGISTATSGKGNGGVNQGGNGNGGNRNPPPNKPDNGQPENNPNSPKGLNGKDFEDWLVKHLNGTGSFKAQVGSQSREFDAAVDDIWIEAKSGEFWASDIRIQKFYSQAGGQQQIAKVHGKTFEVHSNVPIPDKVKQWLNNRGIKYVEY